ncbi:hypothetical protein [Streptomyces sp. NPDC057702]|uniref:hypothetical protein n=1 Tax=unclassified Streptomyces TaxID=2593676 RepID=UPI0036CED60C
MNYPVVAERALSTERRGWWARRRGREDVPALPPGAVYVFRVRGTYREYPSGVAFDPGHPDVMEAASVSLVDTRARLVEVERVLPSVSEADAFTVRASFTCQVTDPALVAQQGTVDVALPLRAYLAGDPVLSHSGAGHRIEEVNTVRQLVSQRMTAYTAIVVPTILGVRAEYVSCDVFTPDDLRTWEQRIRDERRSRELERGKRDFENDDVRRVAELLAQGTSYVDALAVVREDLDVASLAGRAHQLADEDRAWDRELTTREGQRAHDQAEQERALRNKLLVTVLEQMRDAGSIYDVEHVLQQVLDSGRPQPPAGALDAGAPAAEAVPGVLPAREPGAHPDGYPGAYPGAPGGPGGGARGHDREGRGDFLTDEDDLVD